MCESNDLYSPLDVDRKRHCLLSRKNSLEFPSVGNGS